MVIIITAIDNRHLLVLYQTKKKKKKKILDFRVRLHLVRHGETEANRKHIVCGQSDSVSAACFSCMAKQ